jgi:hypothetical protein
LFADELPAAVPLPHVGQLYVFALLLLGNGDLADELLPHVVQYADGRAVDGDALAFCAPQVAHVKESARPL